MDNRMEHSRTPVAGDATGSASSFEYRGHIYEHFVWLMSLLRGTSSRYMSEFLVDSTTERLRSMGFSDSDLIRFWSDFVKQTGNMTENPEGFAYVAVVLKALSGNAA